MAFSSTITLDDATGDDIDYVLVKTNGDGTTRIDDATTLALPGFLNIKHSATGNNGSAVDRHLVQIIRSVDATPLPVQVVVNCTIAVPRNTAVTANHVIDAVSNLCDFLTSGGFTTMAATTNLDALLRGES